MLKIPYISNKVIFINRLSDLPAPVAGVITLQSGTSYFFGGNVNLGTNRLVAPTNVLIGGFSANTCSITSALAPGQSLITSVGNIQISALTLSATGASTSIFSLDATAVPGGRLIMREVIISSSGLGRIANYASMFIFAVVFNNLQSSLVLDGTNGNIIFDTCQWNNLIPGVVSLTFPVTFTAAVRCKILSAGFNSVVGATSINAHTLMTPVSSGFVISNTIFNGGSTTHITGVTAGDDIAFFTGNNGIPNSFAAAHIYMHGNAALTPTAVITNWYKAVGTTTVIASNTQRFSTATPNRVTYTSVETRKFRVSCISTLVDGNDVRLGLALHKNGTLMAETEMSAQTNGTGDPVNVSTASIVELATNDYIEAYVRNYTNNTSVTASDLILIITEI